MIINKILWAFPKITFGHRPSRKVCCGGKKKRYEGNEVWWEKKRVYEKRKFGFGSVG